MIIKTYIVSIRTYKFTGYKDMYDTMVKHWEYCGGTIIYNNTMTLPIWQGNDHILTQFKLTQHDDNIIIIFDEVELT